MYGRHGWPINAKITKLTTWGQLRWLVLLLTNPPCPSETLSLMLLTRAGSSRQLRGIVRRGGYILSAQFRAHLIKLRASPRSRDVLTIFGASVSLRLDCASARPVCPVIFGGGKNRMARPRNSRPIDPRYRRTEVNKYSRPVVWDEETPLVDPEGSRSIDTSRLKIDGKRSTVAEPGESFGYRLIAKVARQTKLFISFVRLGKLSLACFICIEAFFLGWTACSGSSCSECR